MIAQNSFLVDYEVVRIITRQSRFQFTNCFFVAFIRAFAMPNPPDDRDGINSTAKMLHDEIISAFQHDGEFKEAGSRYMPHRQCYHRVNVTRSMASVIAGAAPDH